MRYLMLIHEGRLARVDRAALALVVAIATADMWNRFNAASRQLAGQWAA